MELNIRSGVPIYVQIVEQVEHALAVGTLRPGERMPTVRGLSSELAIAPTTVIKAYDELRRMGLLDSRAGVGTVVVAEVGEVVRERRLEELFERLGGVVRDAAGMGVEAVELERKFGAELGRYYESEKSKKGEETG